MKTYWRDLDIRPAAPGWRAWFRSTHGDGSTWSHPLVGWFVQEETPSIDSYADTDTDAGDRRRRVVAVVYADVPSYLEEIDEGNKWRWLILGPAEDDPTEDEKAAAIADLREDEAREEARLTIAAKEFAPAVLAQLQRGPASAEALASWLDKPGATTWAALRLLKSQGLVNSPPSETSYSGPWSAVPDARIAS